MCKENDMDKFIWEIIVGGDNNQWYFLVYWWVKNELGHDWLYLELKMEKYLGLFGILSRLIF